MTNDHREKSRYPAWAVEFVPGREAMRIRNNDGDMIEHAAAYHVCPDCDGRGEYVSPSIDAHGLGREDFDEDPDFRQDYMSGRYDIQCRTCNGLRVVLEPVSEQGKADLAACLRSEHETQACYAAERAMGA